MAKHSKFNWLAVVALLTLFQTAYAEQRRVWNGKPITIVLPVGKEVRIVFPQEVQVQVPIGISGDLQSLAPDSTMIYWTATKTFDPARIIATAKNGSKVYVIDVGASGNAPAEDIFLEDPELVKAPAELEQSKGAVSNTQVEDEAEAPLTDPAEVVLTRFASQSLYAPSRLMPKSGRIHQQSISKIAKDFPLIQSAQGERYEVEVVGAWSGFNRYITAVLIKNITPIRFQFDPSRVRGNFTHITAQHINIGPKGDLEDRTTIYLISEQPFLDALVEDSYAY